MKAWDEKDEWRAEPALGLGTAVAPPPSGKFFLSISSRQTQFVIHFAFDFVSSQTQVLKMETAL